MKNLKIIKQNKKYIIPVLLISSLIGWVYPKIMKFRLPLGIDTMFTSIVFYGFGYLLASKYTFFKNKIFNEKIKASIIIIMLMLIFVITSTLNGSVDMNNLKFGNYFLYYASAISGSVIVILICQKAKLKSIIWFGQNTINLLYLHEPIKRILLVITSKVFNVEVEFARKSILLTFFNSALLILVLVFVIIIIKRITKKVIERKSNEISYST